MNLPNRQRGISLGSMLIGAVIIVVIAMIAIKLFPPYLEAYQIEESINSVVDEANREKLGPLEIRDRISKRFAVNDIKSVDKKDIKIAREGYQYIITVEYERVIHFVHNIDFLLTFSNQAEVKAI